MLKLRHFTISLKILSHFDFDGSNTSQKKLEQGDVCHSVASPLLLTAVCKHLGSEQLNSPGLLLLDFLFYDAPNFFYW